jgi:hypothetical protein
LIYPNGERYEGSWVYGKRHGFGALTYADGDKYTGSWTDGKMNGQGTYVYADGDKVRRCHRHHTPPSTEALVPSLAALTLVASRTPPSISRAV